MYTGLQAKSYFCPILTKTRTDQQTLAKISNMDSHKILSNGSHTVPYEQRDMTTLIVPSVTVCEHA